MIVSVYRSLPCYLLFVASAYVGAFIKSKTRLADMLKMSAKMPTVIVLTTKHASVLSD